MKRADEKRPKPRAAALRVVLLAAVVIIAVVAAFRLGWLDYHHALASIASLRRSRDIVSFAVLFVFVYGIVTAVGIPGTPFTVAAGALFGTVTGSLLIWSGGMLSAAAGYWIARTVGHDFVAHSMKRSKRVQRAMTSARNFGGMVRLRLFPILPMGVISFVAGLASAPFLSYLLATAIGLIPATIIITYFADSIVAEGAQRSAVTGGVIAVSAILIAFSLAPRLLRSRS